MNDSWIENSDPDGASRFEFQLHEFDLPFCLKRLARYLQQPSPTSRQAVRLVRLQVISTAILGGCRWFVRLGMCHHISLEHSSQVTFSDLLSW